MLLAMLTNQGSYFEVNTTVIINYLSNKVLIAG